MHKTLRWLAGLVGAERIGIEAKLAVAMGDLALADRLQRLADEVTGDLVSVDYEDRCRHRQNDWGLGDPDWLNPPCSCGSLSGACRP